MWWVLSSFYFPRNTVLLSKKWHRVALYNTEKMKSKRFLHFFSEWVGPFFFRFPGRRWLWCSRTMMLGPAAFGGFSYREVTPLPQMHQEIPKSTSHKPPRKVHDSLLELFIVFSWSFQLQWKSVRIIPNPKPKIKKRKGLQGGLHRCFPPPNFVVGNKAFQEKTGKRSTSQHHETSTQNKSFRGVPRCPLIGIPRGLVTIQVEDAGVFLRVWVGWLNLCVFLLWKKGKPVLSPNSTWYVMENIGIASWR